MLEESLPAVDFAALTDLAHEELLLECVADALDEARYWQEPDEMDVALADPRLSAALAPVAARIAASPAATWWSAGLDPSRQVFVDKGEGSVEAAPVLQGARRVLEVWRDQVTGPGTRLRGHWVGGPWWSTLQWSILAKDLERYGQHLPVVAATTQSRPGLGAVGLLLEEDTYGASTALCWPVRPSRPVRVFEIDGADEWMELVSTYGIDVTGKRIAHWSIATGLDRRWILPDWSTAASDYDAVHLSVNGYLTTSGRALSVGTESATFLAGWSPDVSFWLSDMLEVVGLSQSWTAQESNPARRWRPAETT
ncbi:MAG: hypothetical protein M0004_12625 [Actinomycetota bacterium]|nr:hypothetical protein [Actinomycetota bacterium]